VPHERPISTRPPRTTRRTNLKHETTSLTGGGEPARSEAMNQQEPTHLHAPSRYVSRFTPEEFKFRWADALMEEVDDWRTGTDLLVALTLATFMDAAGSCYPSIERLSRAMKKSDETVRRSIKKLEERGWLNVIRRPQKTSLYQAVLPEYGFDLLVESKGLESRSSSAAEWTGAVDHVVQSTCSALGIARAEWAHLPEWARLEGRIRQIIQRMGGPTSDLNVLIRHLCSEPPQQIAAPPQYLLFRAGEFTRLYRAFAGAKRNRSQATCESRALVDEAVAIVLSGMSGKSKGANCNSSWLPN